MDKTLLKIQVLYNDMGKSEKKIADYILSDPGALLPLSITDLADRSQSSEATIVRFAKRLGLSGYQELKITLAQESGKAANTHDIDINDSLSDIYDKVTSDIYRSLEMTKKSLDPKELTEAAQAVLSAGKVVIFGSATPPPSRRTRGTNSSAPGSMRRHIRTIICRQSPRRT